MSRGQFILSADVAKLIQGFVQVNQAQGKTEAGFRKTADAGRQSFRSLEQEIKRLERASQQSAVNTVAGVRARTSGAALSLTATQRAALAGSLPARGDTDMGQLQTVALQRRFLAQGLREQRAAQFAQVRQAQEADARFVRASTSGTGMAWLVSTANRNLAARTAREESSATAAREAAEADRQRQYSLDAELAGLRYENEQRMKVRSAEVRQRIATGALAVGAALTGVAAYAGEELNRYAEAITGFEDTMTPLYGVGSNNRNRGRLREDVLAMSGGSGVPAADVARMKFTLQSAASDLSPAVRDAIEAEALKYYRLQRSDMGQTATALNAALQLTGSQLPSGVAGVRSMSNKLGYAADVGAFEIDQFTPYQSGILGAFTKMGFSVDEALAASAVVSRSGMRPESWSTAVRNLPLLIGKSAGKSGGGMPTSFAGALRGLSNMSGAEMLDLVGRDSFVAAQMLTQNLPLFEQFTAGLGRTGAGSDIAGQKLASGWTDPMKAPAEIIAAARQGQANAPVRLSSAPGLAETVQDWEVRKLGAEMEIHPMMSWFKKPAAWMETVLDTIMDETPGNLLGVGARQLANDARAAGDETKASYVELAYGSDLGTYVDSNGRRRATGRQDADEYAAMVGSGYAGLTGGEFVEYLRLRGANAGAAASYLNKVGGFVASDTAAAGGQGIGAAILHLRAAADALEAAGGEPAPATADGFGLQ